MARVREFDEQALLAGAQELFWSQGFDDTSIEQVTAATGVGNGSIYAAYGTKIGLFLAVFKRYCQQRAQFVDGVVNSASGTEIAAVRAYFDAIIADCASQPNRRGCLMINSIAQLGDWVPEVVSIARQSTQRMENSIAARIGTGDRGDFAHLDPAQIALLSAHIVLVSQGFIQLSRLGVSRERLRKIAEVSSRALAA
jgi:AcrR family transcriptional regulator